MSELSPRTQLAIEALQEDVASDAERARVRARLLALGVAVSAGAGSLSVTSAAAASPLAASAAASVPAPSLAGASSASAAGSGAALGVAGAGKATALTAGSALAKLSSLPLAIKAGAMVAVVAGAGALSVPEAAREPTLQRARPPTAMHTAERRPIVPGPGDAHPSHPPVVMQLEALPETAARETTPQAAALAPAQPRSAKRAPDRRTPLSDTLRGGSTALGAESALLASALGALRAGHLEQARALLDQHQSKFGTHALLARERERMRRELSQTLR